MSRICLYIYQQLIRGVCSFAYYKNQSFTTASAQICHSANSTQTARFVATPPNQYKPLDSADIPLLELSRRVLGGAESQSQR